MHDADPLVINAATRPEDGFDARDLRVAGLWKHIAGFFVFTIASIAFVAFLYDWAIPRIYPDGGLERARNTRPLVPGKPQPLIQGNHEAVMDIVQLKQAEVRSTTTYGWIDQSKGIAHVPVDVAIDTVAKKGLAPAAAAPITSAASTTPATTTSPPAPTAPAGGQQP